MNETSSTTISDWLAWATQRLTSASIDTARLDSRVLLSDILGRDASWLLAHPEYMLQGSDVHILNKKIAQRTNHFPLAYIRGKTEFYGREFAITHHVLTPRPESEAMVDLLKRFIASHPLRQVVDIGTGSGCLAITAKLELPTVRVCATDIDANCLVAAEKNAQLLGANIELLQSDLLGSVSTSLIDSHTVLLANLPYVPADYPINRAASHEPARALFSGTDGLDHYRRLFADIATRAQQPTAVITEAMPMQHAALNQIAVESRFVQQDTLDYAQLFRAVSS